MAQIATLTMNPALDFTTTTATIRPTHKLRCSAPKFGPGGGGINVARVVTALGGSAVAVFPSGGPPGAHVERLLEQAGVPIRAVRIAGFTRQSFSIDACDTGEQYRFVLPGPELTGAEQASCLDALCKLPQKPCWLVASGSLPPGLPGSFFRQVGELCRSHGVKLMLDTSGAALAACEGLGAALIKPSLHELEELMGRSITGEAQEVAAARDLLKRGFAKAVVLSLGVRGALLVTGQVERRFAAIPGPIRSAVGAGDSMAGAIALALSRKIPLIEAVQIGVAAGAAALIAAGPSAAYRKDLAALKTALSREG